LKTIFLQNSNKTLFIFEEEFSRCFKYFKGVVWCECASCVFLAMACPEFELQPQVLILGAGVQGCFCLFVFILFYFIFFFELELDSMLKHCFWNMKLILH
jgi:hypothetical protein